MEKNHSHGHAHEHEPSTNAAGKYYCPMHCEGDKVYDKPGNCPVCGMHLVQQATTDMKKDMQSKATSTENLKGEYYCPMHCEGDKTYEKPGDCPVCGMHLVKAPSAPSRSTTAGGDVSNIPARCILK